MGGQSEKKILQNKQKVIGYYQYPTLACTALFLLSNIYSGYLFTMTGVIAVLVISVVSYFCYNQISNSLDLGLNLDAYSIYLDVLVLNSVIQVGSVVTDLFYYLYLVFPGYLLYKLLLLCWGWVGNVQYVDDGKGNPKKKEKKKEKVKFVKQ